MNNQELTIDLFDEKAPLYRALGMSREDLDICAVHGMTYLGVGLAPEAREVFDGLIAIAPGYYAGAAGMGMVAMHRDDLPEAEVWLSKASTLEGADANIFAKLGLVLLKLGKVDEANAAFEKMEEMDPTGTQPATLEARLLVEQLNESIALADASAATTMGGTIQ